MAPLARRERGDLTDLLDAVGPEAPTLCEGWSAYDLTAHLVLREAFPLVAAGAAVPGVGQLVGRGMDELKAKQDYATLVRRLRDGPPWYSPMRASRVDAAVNGVEFFIHHEDVRRAGTPAPPRELGPRDQDLLWDATRRMGRLLGRRASVGVELVRSDVADSVRISKKEPTAVVRGLPSELTLFAYGRGAVADVEVSGDVADLDTLHGQLGM